MGNVIILKYFFSKTIIILFLLFTSLIQLPFNSRWQNRFCRFLAKVETINYYYQCTCIIFVDIFKLKLLNTYYFYFYNREIFSSVMWLAQGPNFHNRGTQFHLPNFNHVQFNSLYSKCTILLVFKDDYIVEVIYLLIRFLKTFLGVQSMLTETVFTSENSI